MSYMHMSTCHMHKCMSCTCHMHMHMSTYHMHKCMCMHMHM
jgi:hypothetical protein